MTPITLSTPRLLLRPWRDADDDAFAAMFEDPAVMEFLPATSRAEIDAFILRIKQHFADHGYGLWAVELPNVAPFVGYIGLSIPRFDAHFMPAVEVGWRLASAHWSKGYATEGAKPALDAGFTQFGLKEIVSFTVPANRRSIHVMQRIGMQRDPAGDFDHPRLPDGSPLKRHVLYRISRARWEEMSEKH
jgi:RimJ/RimL family protein N-acetyltransferase